MIRICANEIKQVMHQEPKIKMRRREHRMKPPLGVLKINCDASFQPSSMNGSWGFIFAIVMVLLCC